MELRGTRDGGRKRLFGERGASAVEAVIVTPVVMALIFGIIEMGFVFKDYLAVAGAVRAGVRIAAASPRTSTFARLSADRIAKTGGAMDFDSVEEMWVYKVDPADPTSSMPLGKADFDHGCDPCVQFGWDVGTQAFVSTSDTWLASTQNACSSSSLGGPPDRIGVYLKLKHDAFTGLLFNAVYIKESSILSLEPVPVEGGCKPPS